MSLARSTIEPGKDVLEGVAGAAGARAGWIQATGAVEAVQIRVAEAGDTITLQGTFSLLALTGPAAGPLTATLAQIGRRGQVEVVGGELLRARSLGVAVAFFQGEDTDVGTDPEPPVDDRTDRDPSWVAVAQATAEAEARDDDDDEPTELPRQKDRIEHARFGLCDVLLVRGDRLKVRPVKGSPRLREISLSVLKVLRPTVRDGRRVFKLVKRD